MKFTATTESTESVHKTTIQHSPTSAACICTETKVQLLNHMRPTCQITCHRKLLMSKEKMLKVLCFGNGSDKL